jgi:hypothetical protein
VEAADFGEILKNLSGAASSALVLLDYKYPILPLNPNLRERLALVSAIFAAVAGLGVHQFAKRSGRLILGWIFLTAALVVLVAIFWLSNDPPSLSPQTIFNCCPRRLCIVLYFSAARWAALCVLMSQRQKQSR